MVWRVSRTSPTVPPRLRSASDRTFARALGLSLVTPEDQQEIDAERVAVRAEADASALARREAMEKRRQQDEAARAVRAEAARVARNPRVLLLIYDQRVLSLEAIRGWALADGHGYRNPDYPGHIFLLSWKTAAEVSRSLRAGPAPKGHFAVVDMTGTSYHGYGHADLWYLIDKREHRPKT